MQILLILTILVVTWGAWTALSLYRNYQIAKGIKLPIIISPTGSLNPFWIITYKLVFPSILSILRKLPVGRWPRCTYMGWQFDDKHQLHQELGPAFTLCTPSINEVILADPAAVNHVLHKRKDFVKPAVMYDGLNVFGKNLDSAEGETWQRHRKITVPNFNERVSSSVWSEAVRQASQMLSQWTDARTDGTKEVVDDTASLALNVLTYAGFGVKYDFDEARSKVEPPHAMSYRDALYSVLRNYTLLVMLPMNLLKWSILPKTLQAVGKACDEFKLYMKETVDREKASIAQSGGQGTEAHNLLGALVRASQAEERGLTDEELYGNIFIYNLAGHESTANTLATTITYLAADPKWQDWLRDEIVTVLNETENNWTYETLYPRLKRCQAVQLETLRLHGSTVFLPKATATTQPLTIDGQEHIIPPNTFVVTNSQALHCDTRTWGKDALEWRPDRWIVPTIGDAHRAGNEELIEPKPGTFVGWADGPRICPGKKFSQVEFVGVMAKLFQDHGVRVKANADEDEAKARKRLVNMIDDSTITAITLQMKNPRDVALIWEKR